MGNLDEHQPMGLFLRARDVAELRSLLQLPADLGPDESRFSQAAGRVFERLQNKDTGGFRAGWVERVNQSVRELHQLLPRWRR